MSKILTYRAEIYDFGSDYCGNPTAHWSMRNDEGERVDGSKSRRVQCGYQNERDDGPLVSLYAMHKGAKIISRVTGGDRCANRMWVELTVVPAEVLKNHEEWNEITNTPEYKAASKADDVLRCASTASPDMITEARATLRAYADAHPGGLGDYFRSKAGPRWTFTATSRGYMFYKDGEPRGGAGILDSAEGPKGRAAINQQKDYATYCRGECARRNANL